MRGTIPDWNFNKFNDGFICVFIVIANDGWSPIYYDHVRSMPWAKPTFFFISLIIVGQFILFQLFLAILLQEFEERSLYNSAVEKLAEKENKRTAMQRIREWLGARIKVICCPGEKEKGDEENNEENQ